MKKMLLVALFSVMCLVGINNVSAMTEDELKSKLTATYTVNGVEWSISNGYKNQLEQYLANNDLSSADCDYIASVADKALAIVEAGSATSVSELTRTEKDKLKDLVRDVSNNTAVKATVTDKGTFILYNLDGSKFGTIDKTSVKQTGTQDIVIIAGAVSLLGIAIVLRKSMKVNA